MDDKFSKIARAHLENLIRIPSPSGRENEVADYCAKALEKTDFKVRRIPTDDGRNVVYAEFEGAGSGKTLMFAGHIDTVPVTDGWATDPFEPVFKRELNEQGETENRLYGLGANDMKSGIALMLALAEAVSEAGRDKIAGKLTMAFLPDEEAYSVGVRTLLRDGVTADFSIMTEPGYSSVYVGGPGKMLFRASAHGRAAHGGRPQDGINAVTEMGKFLAGLDTVPVVKHAEMGRQEFVPFSIKGGPDFYSLSVPADCSCVISKQLVPGETKEKILADLEKYVGSLDLQGSITFELLPPYYVPYRVDETAPEFAVFEDVCLSTIGKKLPYVIESSVSDSNCLTGEADIPVLMFGADGYGSHQINEYMRPDSLAYVFEIYREFTYRYLK